MVSTRTAPRGRALSASQAWSAIAAFVFYHDLTCNKGELLSEGVDRGLEHHRPLVFFGIAVTAAHLLNLLPTQLDPYSWIWKLTKGNL